MAENVYEGMFILDANQFARDAAGASRKVEQLIRGAGAELLVSRLWEERRLAYPIRGQRKGTYWLTYFRSDSGKLAGLERQCRIQDVILRHLFLKVDRRIVEAVISHAKAGAEKPRERSERGEPAAGGLKEKEVAAAGAARSEASAT